jgi:PAS domain S-box-containing protein
MTGYKPNELKGKNVSQLMTEEYKKFHDGYLRAYLKSRMPKIIGTGRDVIMQRKDGSITPIHLQVTEKIIGDKLYFFGTMKKATDAVQQKTMLQQEREVLDGLIVPAIIIDEKGTIHGFNGYVTPTVVFTSPVY